MKQETWIVNRENDGSFSISAYNLSFKCQIGSNGLTSLESKIEGDKTTPRGFWLLKSIYYRHDRLNLPSLAPNCCLKMKIINEDCGWCDDPSSNKYNKYIKIKKHIQFRYEKLWRVDGAYDIIIELDYNQNPTIKQKGSAIFVHCSFENLNSTAGCVAVKKNDLITLIKKIKNKTYLKL